ncbi:hypothetical protein PSTG_08228 [Puccinia striiformis f. sp. tritici PST-78]|uniref:DUF6589 domain-containing protein n=1 Tax=Puccinia striiformis f. sp. tritici PST-78 TaxID=1165861 RepID=A0A0L0VGW9_9BASI|nr:hypothetical protein PSTG_08228 [Puccinia striiformis f. sp. tritici PST-78]
MGKTKKETGDDADSRKALEICKNLQALKMTPKEFMITFLTSKNSDLASRRRLWTIDNGHAIRVLVQNNQRLERSAKGHWQSSQSVKPEFFSEAAKIGRESTLIKDEMPFLYGILMGMLEEGATPNIEEEEDTDLSEAPLGPSGTVHPPADAFEAQLLEGEGYTYIPELLGKDQRKRRFHHLAATICAQLLFTRNRRHNAFQLFNSLRFVPTGVTERVNDYLHKLGLTSSRQTAIEVLKTLSVCAQDDLKGVMSLTRSPDLGPFICLDNLDIEEKVHMASVENRTMMFHGTWGYVQLPCKSLLDTLDRSELNMAVYRNAIKDIPTMSINPNLFMPSPEAEDHYYSVWTSQIAQVMKDYIALPSHSDGAISTEPPVLDQISCEIPSIFMLKLMDESDNSAEGIGQVLESVQEQSGLSAQEFSSRLQPMDGDLGTIQNFNSIRDLRHPSAYSEHSFNNVIFQLGGSHTMWNIAQVILTTHFGDPSNEKDVGVWQYLEALGIPHEKVIQKKDFTLMLQQMELVHKATLYHCLRMVMKTEKHKVNLEREKIATGAWNSIILECYERFCSPRSRHEAAKESCPKLHNLLVRMQEFSTVVEANNAMKAGDIGRLINIWKMWSVMSQSLKGLTHYASYLPRLVLLLTEILPASLSKLLRHNMLFSPSGRPNHFVAKDRYLENMNYWLKFFFNRGGVGTEVQRLKNLFSLNIVYVRCSTRFRLIVGSNGYIRARRTSSTDRPSSFSPRWQITWTSWILTERKKRQKRRGWRNPLEKRQRVRNLKQLCTTKVKATVQNKQ